jgi:hypothetical protein
VPGFQERLGVARGFPVGSHPNNRRRVPVCVRRLPRGLVGTVDPLRRRRLRQHRPVLPARRRGPQGGPLVPPPPGDRSRWGDRPCVVFGVGGTDASAVGFIAAGARPRGRKVCLIEVWFV